MGVPSTCGYTIYLRLCSLSKPDTRDTAPRMPPSTTPPATAELRRFFREGVMAAAASGATADVAITAAKAAAAITFSLEASLVDSLHTNPRDDQKVAISTQNCGV